jgi:hypothetical protein
MIRTRFRTAFNVKPVVERIRQTSMCATDVNHHVLSITLLPYLILENCEIASWRK